MVDNLDTSLTTRNRPTLLHGLCRLKADSINPFMSNGFFYLQSSDQSISSIRGVWLVLSLLIPCFIEIPAFNANSVDPDQTPHFATSDLGLKCLPMSLL